MLALIPFFPIFPCRVREGGVETGPLISFVAVLVFVFGVGPVGVVGVGVAPAFAVCVVGFSFYGVGEDFVGRDDEAVAFDTDVAGEGGHSGG